MTKFRNRSGAPVTLEETEGGYYISVGEDRYGNSNFYTRFGGEMNDLQYIDFESGPFIAVGDTLDFLGVKGKSVKTIEVIDNKYFLKTEL